jgi:hypothetical protein
MASNGTRFRGMSAPTFVDDSPSSPALFGDIVGLEFLREVVGDSSAALANARAAVARLERQIDNLWRDSMETDDQTRSQRLAEVGHALRRAALLLEHDDAIG